MILNPGTVLWLQSPSNLSELASPCLTWVKSHLSNLFGRQKSNFLQGFILKWMSLMLVCGPDGQELLGSPVMASYL